MLILKQNIKQFKNLFLNNLLDSGRNYGEEIDNMEGNIKNSGFIGKNELINFLKTIDNPNDKNIFIKIWNKNWEKFGQKGIPTEKFNKYLKQYLNNSTSKTTQILKNEIIKSTKTKNKIPSNIKPNSKTEETQDKITILENKMKENPNISLTDAVRNFYLNKMNFTKNDILKIENKLVKQGFLENANSNFDNKTYIALLKFQKQNNLTIDGKAGTKTLIKLGLINQEQTYKDFYEKFGKKEQEEIIEKKQEKNADADKTKTKITKKTERKNSYNTEKKEENKDKIKDNTVIIPISKDKIKISEIKNNNEIILNNEAFKKELEYFKLYCKYNNIENPDNFIKNLHKNILKLPQDEQMIFGKKTINYLKQNVYPYKEMNNLKNDFISKFEKEKNKFLVQDINLYLGKINKYLKKYTTGNTAENLINVKAKLENLKKQGKTKFRIYSEMINKDINVFFKENYILNLSLFEDGKNWANQNPNISKNNDAYLVKEKGKYRIYYFNGGNLIHASYVSPGKDNGEGGGYSLTTKGTFNLKTPDINHISSSFRGLKINSEGKIVGWTLANSRLFNKNKGQALHISYNTTGNRESHGCIRIKAEDSLILSKYNGIKIHILDN